jgi:hypothetical protein
MKFATPISEPQQAVFTVSIDFELMWGTADRPYAAAFRSLCETERREVIDRLLGLMAEYDISATWGIVGHLFLQDGEKVDRPGPEVEHHGADNLYYGSDLVERVRRCPVEQEIGSHTFFHIEMDESKCSPETADADVANCARQARRWGIDMKSFIFPRNLVGHLQTLKRYGFTCFRGPEPHWYANRSRLIRRLGHLLEILAMKTPPSVTVSEQDGMWNIPGSMLYTPSWGSRRYLPVWMRVLRAKRGLRNAVRHRQIFHLWFHPTDLAGRPEAMIDGLRQIFEYAARLRASGRLVVRPMKGLVPSSVCESSEQERIFA